LPYVIGRPSKFLALAGTIAGLLVAASPAMAHRTAPHRTDTVPQAASQPTSSDASCPTVAASQLLTDFGDLNYYAPLDEGTFEGSTDDWTLNDATVVNDNEPWHVVSSTDSQSLSVASGGSATSPSVCIDSRFPSFRFFAESSSGGEKSRLYVSVQLTDAQGNTVSTNAYSLHARGYSSWALSPSFAFDAGSATVSAQIEFSTTHGSWRIDDVLLDPYAK
jgi:hypothetical protein